MDPVHRPIPTARARSRIRGLSLVFPLSLGSLCLIALGCAGGSGVGPNADAPLETVERVDLERFAGLWYVIENMPTSAEEGAHDATEHYALRDDGQIDITFRFRKDAFDGPEETLEMTGWVHDETTRAEWRVRPVWPIRLAYLILALAPDYSYTVVGHPSKRYVWIMSRTPTLDPTILATLREMLAESGYDVDRIQRVPQSGSGSAAGSPVEGRAVSSSRGSAG